jgi:hypothetical protein
VYLLTWPPKQYAVCNGRQVDIIKQGFIHGTTQVTALVLLGVSSDMIIIIMFPIKP